MLSLEETGGWKRDAVSKLRVRKSRTRPGTFRSSVRNFAQLHISAQTSLGLDRIEDQLEPLDRTEGRLAIERILGGTQRSLTDDGG